MQEYKNIPVDNKNVSAAKPEKKAQAQKAQIQKAQGKKKKKKISAAALVCIVLIVAICGAAAAVYFNIAGLKHKVVSFLQPGAAVTATVSPSASSDQAAADPQASDIEQKKEDLDAREKKVKQAEDDLAKKEQDIKKREDAVTAAETKLNADTQSQDAMKASAKIFEQMDAAKAADAISGMATPDAMTKVLLMMSSDKAAQIMNNMKPELTAQILAVLTK